MTVEGNVRLDLIRRLGLPLLHALAQLHTQGKQHEDLSPTDIIVERKGSVGHGQGYEATFIDFGRNYLYTSAVGGLEGAEGVYVAPEIATARTTCPLPTSIRWDGS
jgi:serine/threonine protein kinase